MWTNGSFFPRLAEARSGRYGHATRHLQTCAFDAGQPIVMVLLTHLWISALAAINSCPLPVRLTNPLQLNLGAIQLAHFFQKAQISIRIGPHESTAMSRQG
jgi:hypothetical protein